MEQVSPREAFLEWFEECGFKRLRAAARELGVDPAVLCRLRKGKIATVSRRVAEKFAAHRRPIPLEVFGFAPLVPGEKAPKKRRKKAA